MIKITKKVKSLPFYKNTPHANARRSHVPKFDEYEPRSATAVYKPIPDAAQQKETKAESGKGREKITAVRECAAENNVLYSVLRMN